MSLTAFDCIVSTSLIAEWHIVMIAGEGIFYEGSDEGFVGN